jgi:hypothetical protein
MSLFIFFVLGKSVSNRIESNRIASIQDSHDNHTPHHEVPDREPRLVHQSLHLLRRDEHVGHAPVAPHHVLPRGAVLDQVAGALSMLIDWCGFCQEWMQAKQQQGKQQDQRTSSDVSSRSSSSGPPSSSGCAAAPFSSSSPSSVAAAAAVSELEARNPSTSLVRPVRDKVKESWSARRNNHA